MYAFGKEFVMSRRNNNLMSEELKVIIVNTKMYNLGKIFLYKIVHFYLVLFVQFYFALLKSLCHIY